jgi:DNA repair exonuclease SbcCD ATPase subunit
LHIQSIEIKDVLSIKNMSLSFPDSGLILVEGWNHDDDTSNGSGKTSIFNAISLCLFGKLPRKITNSKIVRKGSKSFTVKVVVKSGKDVIEITRTKPKSFVVLENGVEVNWTQDELDSRLGMKYDQFLLTCYRAQKEGKSLIALNDADKKDLFLNLIDLNKFSEMKTSVDVKAKELLSEVFEIESKISKLVAKREVYEESLIDVDDVKEQISRLDVYSLQSTVDQLSSIEKPDTARIQRDMSKIREQLENIRDEEAESKTLRSRLVSLKERLGDIEDNVKASVSSVECPHCSTEFVLSSDTVMKNSDLDHIVEQKRQDILLKMSSVVDQINSIKSSRGNKEHMLSKLNELREREEKEKSKYSDAKIQIAECKSKINAINLKRQGLEEKLEEQEQIQENIDKIRVVTAKLQSTLKGKKQELTLHQEIASILSPTGAPAYVLDSIVESFNSVVGDVLSDVWPNASYQLLTYKENSSGDVRSKMSERLVINGVDVDVGQLSGGELSCLSIALDLALMIVFESATGKHINTLVLDEQFENMDNSNRERCLEALARYAQDRCVFVIDHSSESKSSFSTSISIEKRNGISSVI